MSDREIDQQLVERAQRGDKHAFELLVVKYQRKLIRLLSRFIRDTAEVEDVAQEAFIKAYRALPNFRGDSAFYTWLYRIGINTAKNYLVAMGRRAPTSTSMDAEEAEDLGETELLQDLNTPENSRAHRAYRAIHGGGDFLVTEALHFPQRDSGAQIFRQLIQRLVHGIRHLAAHHQIFRGVEVLQQLRFTEVFGLFRIHAG